MAETGQPVLERTHSLADCRALSAAARHSYRHPTHRSKGLQVGPEPSKRATIFFVSFTRWDPLRDLFAIQERLERMADAGAAGWTPPVDLYETEDRFVLSAELPGLTRDDIDINVQDGTLTIHGSRPSSSIPCERYHRVERGHGAFVRRFSVHAAVDVEHVTADLKDGVLTLTLPKSAAALPRRIEVS
jgi:HSP20 family protein